MRLLAHLGLRRTLLGWTVFLGGLMLLSRLHTFRDAMGHSAIFPLFVLFWIGFAMAVWDGCKAMTLQVRLAFLLLQVAIAVLASALFFQHLLQNAP